MDWFRVCGDLLNDPYVGALTDAEFRAEFTKALENKPSVMSRHVVGGYARLHARTWKEVRRLVFDRDGEQCAYCGTITGPFEVDHIKALANGGTNSIDNLTVACRACNRSKNAKPLETWKGANYGLV